MLRDPGPVAPSSRRPRIGSALVRAGLVVAASTLAYRSVRFAGTLRGIGERLRRYGVQLGEISASVTGVYRGLTNLPDAPPRDAVRLIWLSDAHNNPVAFAVAAALAEQYPGALVVDTGDIADWGRDIEAPMHSGVAAIDAPYLFIKGNHDGPRTIAALRRHPNVVVLEDGAGYRHDGVTIAGDADPRFTPDKSTGDDHFGKERLAEVGRELAARLAGSAPDVVLVHDPVVAAQLGGVTPLVLCGHTHRRRAKRIGGTLVLTQGSSGGAGLRGVRQDPPDPLTVSVLHLDRHTRRLHSVDELTLGGLGSTTVSLVRRRADELGRPDGSPEKV